MAGNSAVTTDLNL